MAEPEGEILTLYGAIAYSKADKRTVLRLKASFPRSGWTAHGASIVATWMSGLLLI